MLQKLAQEKLSELVKNKAVNKSSNHYRTALAAINSPNEFQQAGKNLGSGRHASSVSWMEKVEIIFRLLQIPYSTKNVAKFGGRSGDRIAAILETEPESNLITLETSL